MKRVKSLLYYIYYCLEFLFILIAFIVVFSYLTFYYLINHHFSKQEIKAIISSQLEQEFMRQTTVDSVLFDPYGRIQIKGLRVYSRDRKSRLIFCPLIIGKFSPYSIISGKIEIKSIKMISPEIFLYRDETAKWGFEDIIEKWKNKKSKWAIIVDEVFVKDGNIRIEDLKQKLSHYFEKIDFHADLSRVPSHTSFTISSEFSSSCIKTGKNVSLYLNADLICAGSLKECSLDNITASATLDDEIYSLKGKIESLAAPHGEIIAELPSIDLRKFTSIKDEIYIPRSEVMIKFTFKPDIDTLNFSAYSQKLNTSLYGYYSLNNSQKNYDFICKVENMPAENIKMVLSPYVRNPAGFLYLDMRFFAKRNEKKWNISASFNDASFSDLENIVHFTRTKGKIILNKTFKALNITDGQAIIGKNNLERINFKWETSDNLEKFSGSTYFNGKKTSFMGMIKNNETPKRNGEVSIYSEKADINEISDLLLHIADARKKAKIKKTSDRYNFIGKNLDIYFNSNNFENDYVRAEKIFFQSNFSSFSTSFNDIKGNFILKAEKGTFSDVQTNAEKNSTYYLISLPVNTIYKMSRAGVFKLNSHIKNIDFSQLGIDCSLNNGKIVLRNFYIDGRDIMAHSRGEIDFLEEKMDLYAYVLNKKFNSMGGLPEALTDAKGSPALAFRLKGNFKNITTKILDPNSNPEIIRKAIENGAGIRTDKFLFSEGKWQK